MLMLMSMSGLERAHREPSESESRSRARCARGTIDVTIPLAVQEHNTCRLLPRNNIPRPKKQWQPK